MEKKIIGWKEINLSEKAKEKLASLNEGEVLAVAAKHVHDYQGYDKYQIEFAEKIQTDDRVENALTMFNAGDNRFTSGARRTWVTIMANIAEEKFNFKLSPEESHKELLFIMPEAREGHSFRIRIREFIESQLPQEQIEYKDQRLKRRGMDGPVFYTTINGKKEKVYTLTDLIIIKNDEKVPHLYLEGDYISAEELISEEMTGSEINKIAAQEANNSGLRI